MVEQVAAKNIVHVLHFQPCFLHRQSHIFLHKKAFRLFPCILPEQCVLHLFVEIRPQRALSFFGAYR